VGGNQIFTASLDSGGVSGILLQVVESREVAAGAVDEKQEDLAQALRCGGAFAAFANIGEPAVGEPGQSDLVDIPRKQEQAGATGQVVASQFDGGNLGMNFS
jgi:hypothetical protein